MKKKQRNKRISPRKVRRLLGWICGIAAVTITAGFVRSGKRAATCSHVDIHIDKTLGHAFVIPEDVLDMMSGPDRQPVGRKLVDINIAMLENMIRRNVYVAHAEVFSTIDGTLHFDIRQRKPVIRIINHREEQFYIDEAGGFMPVSTRYAANVVVASGYIFNRYAEGSVGADGGKQTKNHEPGRSQHQGIIEQLYDLALFIDRDSFWNSQIEQVYVNETGMLELVPRVGNHLILLGDTRNMETRFENLRLFYKQAMDSAGWHDYKMINLFYEGQVVCSK